MLEPGDLVYTPGTILEQWQKQLIIGTVMGDAYLLRRKNSASLVCAQGEKQRDYVQWKYKLLENIGVSAPKGSLRKGSFKSGGVSWRFQTRAHQDLNAFWKRFYKEAPDKRKKYTKVVPSGIVAEMGWYGLGVWFGRRRILHR